MDTHRVSGGRQRSSVATVRSSLQEVGDALDQEVSVFEVCKQEVHLVLSADGHRTGQDAAAVRLLHDGHLWSRVGWTSGLRSGRRCSALITSLSGMIS